MSLVSVTAAQTATVPPRGRNGVCLADLLGGDQSFTAALGKAGPSLVIAGSGANTGTAGPASEDRPAEAGPLSHEPGPNLAAPPQVEDGRLGPPRAISAALQQMQVVDLGGALRQPITLAWIGGVSGKAPASPDRQRAPATMSDAGPVTVPTGLASAAVQLAADVHAGLCAAPAGELAPAVRSGGSGDALATIGTISGVPLPVTGEPPRRAAEAAGRIPFTPGLLGPDQPELARSAVGRSGGASAAVSQFGSAEVAGSMLARSSSADSQDAGDAGFAAIMPPQAASQGGPNLVVARPGIAAEPDGSEPASPRNGSVDLVMPSRAAPGTSVRFAASLADAGFDPVAPNVAVVEQAQPMAAPPATISATRYPGVAAAAHGGGGEPILLPQTGSGESAAVSRAAGTVPVRFTAVLAAPGFEVAPPDVAPVQQADPVRLGSEGGEEPPAASIGPAVDHSALPVEPAPSKPAPIKEAARARAAVPETAVTGSIPVKTEDSDLGPMLPGGLAQQRTEPVEAGLAASRPLPPATPDGAPFARLDIPGGVPAAALIPAGPTVAVAVGSDTGPAVPVHATAPVAGPLDTGMQKNVGPVEPGIAVEVTAETGLGRPAGAARRTDSDRSGDLRVDTVPFASAPGGALAVAANAAGSGTGSNPDSLTMAALPHRLSEQLVQMASGAARDVVLQLHPPELGAVTVRVMVAGHDVSAWFTSSQPEVQQTISQAIGQLQTDLGNAGYNLNGAWVGGDAPSPRGRNANGALPGSLRGPVSGMQRAAAEPGYATRSAAAGVSIYV